MDSNGYVWAENIKALLQETCATVSKRKRKKLTQAEYKTLQRRYRNILTRGGKELPPIPARQKGKRGKVAKSDAHNLWERLKQHESAVLLFAKESYVPFTNNRAERDLRMSKVKQKYRAVFVRNTMPKRIAVSRATYKQWQTRATILLSLYSGLSPGKSILMGARSYVENLYSIDQLSATHHLLAPQSQVQIETRINHVFSLSVQYFFNPSLANVAILLNISIGQTSLTQ